MSTILLRSNNKKAISAIKTLARELKMEVDESFEIVSKISTASVGKESFKEKWDGLIKSGVLEPSDPSVKISESAGIWTGKGITLDQLRKKAWKRSSR